MFLSILVILDDDVDGKSYKDKIIKIGGSYSITNVLTIRDLVGGIVDGGTIEDAMDMTFIESKFVEVYEKTFPTHPAYSLFGAKSGVRNGS